MTLASPPFLRSLQLTGGSVGLYPFDIPAVQQLDRLAFAPVTFLAGDNGSGKSTVIEALAVATGFNAEGGGRNLQFETMKTHSELARDLELSWSKRPEWGWFLRAETFYGMATHITLDNDPMSGIAMLFPDLHDRSHGQSFLTLIESRFERRGFYLMDEPESALSFHGQLKLLRLMHDAVRNGSQFIIATHSPLLMRMPGAALYELDDDGITACDYDDLGVVALWRRFLTAPERMLDTLFAEEPPDEPPDEPTDESDEA